MLITGPLPFHYILSVTMIPLLPINALIYQFKFLTDLIRV